MRWGIDQWNTLSPVAFNNCIMRSVHCTPWKRIDTPLLMVSVRVVFFEKSDLLLNYALKYEVSPADDRRSSNEHNVAFVRRGFKSTRNRRGCFTGQGKKKRFHLTMTQFGWVTTQLYWFVLFVGLSCPVRLRWMWLYWPCRRDCPPVYQQCCEGRVTGPFAKMYRPINIAMHFNNMKNVVFYFTATQAN